MSITDDDERVLTKHDGSRVYVAYKPKRRSTQTKHGVAQARVVMLVDNNVERGRPPEAAHALSDALLDIWGEEIPRADPMTPIAFFDR